MNPFDLHDAERGLVAEFVGKVSAFYGAHLERCTDLAQRQHEAGFAAASRALEAFSALAEVRCEYSYLEWHERTAKPALEATATDVEGWIQDMRTQGLETLESGCDLAHESADQFLSYLQARTDAMMVAGRELESGMRVLADSSLEQIVPGFEMPALVSFQPVVSPSPRKVAPRRKAA